MAIKIHGNLTLEQYQSTTFLEEGLESLQELENVPYEAIGTEGVWEAGKAAVNFAGSTAKLTATVAKTGVKATTAGLKTGAGIVKNITIQFKKALPILLKNMDQLKSNLEKMYMKAMHYDQKFREIAIKANQIKSQKLYESIEKIPYIKIQYHFVNPICLKWCLDNIVNYSAMMEVLIGVDPATLMQSKKLNGRDILFPTKTGKFEYAPADLARQLKGVSVEQYSEILEKAVAQISEINAAMASNGKNTFMIRILERTNSTIQGDIAKEISKDNGKNKLGNVVKHACIPRMAVLELNQDAWVGKGKPALRNLIETPYTKGGIFDSFLYLVNGEKNSGSSTSSAILYLLKTGGKNITKDVEKLKKDSKNMLDEFLKMAQAYEKKQSEAGQKSVHQDQSVSANSNDTVQYIDKKGNDVEATASPNDPTQMLQSYVMAWFNILTKINTIYDTTTTGLMGATFTMAQEVEAICDMIFGEQAISEKDRKMVVK